MDDETRITISVRTPRNVHAALAREAARRAADSGRPVSAASVAREVLTKALGLPVPRMVVGRPAMAPSTATATSTRSPAPAVRHRTRSTPPAAA